ncbi:hypothetical protein Q4551_09930 [Oceanobacter sp. 5_MG-2023]|uniref:hypothetical protein n=1 Tax=Oceanobacter sp. 5_MG-2023 TaxID=3062645 RepID=UPI0026E2B721|nr:hypothetical protein [Oceanobacter sp. 5_MG-2023]MDO6682610.1 hypothetical protein [Oceanobacter sp. 5_MG-2023]
MLQQARAFILMSFLIITTVYIPGAYANALDGEKTIFLIDKKGNAIDIGRVTFDTSGTQISYQLQRHHNKFKDFFLSMKEMKCLEGPELMCHLSYPYTQPHTLTPDNLVWLSHDLLFMYKQPAEFGANFWNGIYYDLRIEDGIIKGTAQAVDLNLLASPPDNLDIPPISAAERDETDPKSRWLPYLEIR